jgi:hypothetical protein
MTSKIILPTGLKGLTLMVHQLPRVNHAESFTFKNGTNPILQKRRSKNNFLQILIFNHKHLIKTITKLKK